MLETERRRRLLLFHLLLLLHLLHAAVVAAKETLAARRGWRAHPALIEPHCWHTREAAGTSRCAKAAGAGAPSIRPLSLTALVGYIRQRKAVFDLVRSTCHLLLQQTRRPNESGGVSEKELSELLARDLLIPVAHGVTYDEIRAVSPLLGSRNGMSTAEDSMEDIAKKVAELVAV